MHVKLDEAQIRYIVQHWSYFSAVHLFHQGLKVNDNEAVFTPCLGVIVVQLYNLHIDLQQ